MFNPQALNCIKAAATGIVGIGTTKITHAIINNNINPETVFDKTTVGAASVVVGMMAADASRSFTNLKIDELASAVEPLLEKISTSEK